MCVMFDIMDLFCIFSNVQGVDEVQDWPGVCGPIYVDIYMYTSALYIFPHTLGRFGPFAILWRFGLAWSLPVSYRCAWCFHHIRLLHRLGGEGLGGGLG